MKKVKYLRINVNFIFLKVRYNKEIKVIILVSCKFED